MGKHSSIYYCPISDARIMQNEAMFIERRLNSMKAMFASIDKIYAPLKDEHPKTTNIQLYAKRWTFYPPALVSELTDYTPQKNILIDALNYVGGNTVINLNSSAIDDIGPFEFDDTLYKSQIIVGQKHILRRTTVMVQFPSNLAKGMYLHENVFYSAMICIGGDSDDKRAYLLFELNPGKLVCIEPEEICVLSAINKDENSETGILTVYKKKYSHFENLLYVGFINGSPTLAHAKLPEELMPQKKEKNNSSLEIKDKKNDVARVQ